jgi:hypothetical protein
LLRLSIVKWTMTSLADSRRAHTDCFGDVPPRESLSSRLKSPIALEQSPRPADGPSAPSSILPRPREPSTNSNSFLFGETGQQTDDDIAERAGAINPRFREAAPSNAVALQQFQALENGQGTLSC